MLLSCVVTAAALRAPAPRCCAAGAPLKTGSLLSIADQYDALLLDQFGVIHDGKVAYEGAVDAVTELQRRASSGPELS